MHWIARQVPGSTSVRPWLHRLRGVSIKRPVFIGDDVYIDNEYPECVELHENVSISMRVTIVAHTRGPGKVILEKDSFVGPGSIICTSVGRVIRIGEGAVISAGSVITKSVPPGIMVAPAPSRPVAEVQVPFTDRVTMKEFLGGMKPLKSRSKRFGD